MNNMLTLEEVKHYLEIENERLEHFIRDGKLHAYKIGGTYIRFRKEEVLNLRYDVLPNPLKQGAGKISSFSKIAEFWRFNNFYILSIIAIIGLIIFVLKT